MELREELNRLLEEEDILNPRVLELSKKLDEVIIEYMQVIDE